MNKQTADNSSKITEFRNRASIKEEAGAWIVKMDQGPLSPDQTAELQQWIAKSEFHRTYLHQLAHNWDSMGILQELAELFPIQPTPVMPAKAGTSNPHTQTTPVMPAQAGISGTHAPTVTPANPTVTPANPTVTPANPPVTPANPTVMPAQAGISGTHTQPELVMPAQAGISNPQSLKIKTWLQNLIAQLKQPKAWAPTLATFALVAILINSQQSIQYETEIGQQASYQLDDGTTVTLNTNTRIDIDFSQERRVVRLLKGEANFEVAKNPQRPFMVYAGDGMVWAVGTAFNVRYLQSTKQAPPTIDVTVTEGRVKVFAQLEAPASITHKPTQQQPKEQQQHEQLVDAGNSVQYSTQITNASSANQVALEQKLAWQKGALVFKGETLQQALAEIARYTAKDLIITDPSIASIRVGGHYKTDNIDSLLVTLGHSFGIQVRLMDNNSIQLSSKK